MSKRLLPIQNAKQFDAGFHALGMGLVASHVTYKMFKDISTAFDEFRQEVNQSRAFWGITAEALRDVSVLGLCRVFDQYEGTNSLPNLLEKILATADFADLIRKDNEQGLDVPVLPPHNTAIDPMQIEADIAFCKRKTNASLQRVLNWRENMLAHQNWTFVVKKKRIPSSPTLKDFDTLFDEGINIVNRYAGLFRTAEYKSFMPGSDDYRFVFESVREHCKLIRAKQDEQMRSYGLDPEKYRSIE